MSYKTDENYYFATTYKINWNWLKCPNLNEPCCSLPQWWCCFHHAGVSCVCTGCVELFVSRTGAASGVLAQHHHLFFPSKTSPTHSFSLFCPHDISAFRTSYLLLPPILQNLTKSVSHCPHIKGMGFPLWVATPYMNLGTLTYFPLLLISEKKHAEFSCFLSTRSLASYHDLGMKKFSWLEISHADTAHTLSSKSLFIKKSIQISTPQLVN